MKYLIALTVVLTGIWLAWSGHYTTLILSLGAASIALTVWVSHRMGIVDEEGAPTHLPLRLVTYLPWLFLEIAKSNLDVAIRILRPDMPIKPQVITVHASQDTDLCRAIYANSITLTPGTVTIATEGDVFTVHALSSEAAAGVETGEMDRRVSGLEGNS